MGYAAAGVSRETLIRLVDYPELPLRIHTRETIKAGRSALLVRGEFPIGGRMVSVAYKRIKRRNTGKAIAAWLLGNRTLRAWRMSRTFEQRGISTSRPLLVVLPRWYRPFAPSYLALEWLEDARNITAYSAWLGQQPKRVRQARLRDAAATLGKLIGKMHQARLSHRDLKAGNLLLINRPSSVEGFVIDLDGARRHVWLSPHRRYRDLSRFALATEQDSIVTHAARLRFLLSYLKAIGEDAIGWKTRWRQLARITKQRRKQKRHKQQ